MKIKAIFQAYKYLEELNKPFPYETSSAAEWLQEVLQKSCKRVCWSSSKFWLFNTAVESSLVAINSTVAAVQKIPESRSVLQSGFEKTKNVVTGNGLALISTIKRNTGFKNTIIMIHCRGVDRALVASSRVKTTRKSKCN